MEPKEKTRGYVLTSVGTLTIVLAVLLFGLTTDSGEIDWVSVITAAAGFVMAATGLYLVFRTTGPRPAS
jgi:predicted anti-sigma-YlaC factor YlaD